MFFLRKNTYLFSHPSTGIVLIIIHTKNRTRKEMTYTDIEELLPDYCEGLTTAEETHQVEEWMEQDEANCKMVKQMQLLNLATDTLHIMQCVDADKAFQKVKGEIIKKKNAWWKWAQRVAALLFLPLLITTFVIGYDDDKQAELTQMLEVRTNPGMTTSVVLPDSTVVCLNSESVLRYPSVFNKNSREVELSGEAYFDVMPDKKKRFVVTIPHQSQIEVYGTSFNVEAYPTDKHISTTLVEGQVGFLFKEKNGDAREIILSPKHKLLYNPESGETQIHETSCNSEIAWKEGEVIFNNTPMDEVLAMLSKRFNVEFIIKNKHLKEYSFTSTFTTQRLDRILEFFKLSSHIHWRYIDSDKASDKKQKIEIY